MLALEAAAHLPLNGVLVSIDLDCHPMTPDKLVTLVRAQAFASVGAQVGWPGLHAWDVITPNSPRQYYDRWALRSDRLGLNFDCWFNQTAKSHGK